jgi:hypothetical protein
MKMKWVALSASIGALAVVSLIVLNDNDASSGEEILNVRGARSVAGVSFTNYEREPLADCSVRALDDGADWSASLGDRRISPSETVRLSWSEFSRDGQPLDVSIGLRRNNFVVRCVAGNDWKSVGLHF